MAAGIASRKTLRGPRQQRVLEAIGVQVWVPRAGSVPVPDPAPVRVPDVAPMHMQSAPIPESGLTAWTELRAEVAACTRCALHKTRTQTVFGTGSPQARWLVIGEAPGADEDRQGEPFVGRAGQLLTEMLRAVGVSREQVFIANVLKCRPPENRDPTPEEAKSCESYLQRQIALIQPSLILVVGRIAAQNLLQVDTPIGKLRGEVHAWGPTRIPVVVTYHPAYLLRSPGQKARAWDDLCLARDRVAPI
ncbi:MAG: uracil-DNA glycosylase [Chromatiales bacterium]|nr:uracil-DNA glycosylase [Chromatiales bacterium]